jgi:hypothetical protein
VLPETLVGWRAGRRNGRLLHWPCCACRIRRPALARRRYLRTLHTSPPASTPKPLVVNNQGLLTSKQPTLLSRWERLGRGGTEDEMKPLMESSGRKSCTAKASRQAGSECCHSPGDWWVRSVHTRRVLLYSDELSSEKTMQATRRKSETGVQSSRF